MKIAKADYGKIREAISVLEKYIDVLDIEPNDPVRENRDVETAMSDNIVSLLENISRFDTMIEKTNYTSLLENEHFKKLSNVQFNSDKVIAYLSLLQALVLDIISDNPEMIKSIFIDPILILASKHTDDGSMYSKMLCYFWEFKQLIENKEEYLKYHTVVRRIYDRLLLFPNEFGVEPMSKKDADIIPHINVSEMRPKVECENKYIPTYIFPKVDYAKIDNPSSKIYFHFYEDKYMDRLATISFIMSNKRDIIDETYGLISMVDTNLLFDAPLRALFATNDNDTYGLYCRVLMYYHELIEKYARDNSPCYRFAKTIFFKLLQSQSNCVETLGVLWKRYGYDRYKSSLKNLEYVWKLRTQNGYGIAYPNPFGF